MTRKLADDERALWARVAATVRPLHRVAVPVAVPRQARLPGARPRPAAKPVPVRSTPPPPLSNTLDGNWDRRLARGLVHPDRQIDLHDHGLAAAHALLDRRLEEAIEAGARVILLITGRPPASDVQPVGRGAIRAAIDDWLAASRHAGDVAAVRGAHPRHGGAGALYLILRNRRRGHRPNS